MMKESIVELNKTLREMDNNISEFLEKNERKFGGTGRVDGDDEDYEPDYETPVWQEYKSLIKARRKVSVKLQKALGRGYI